MSNYIIEGNVNFYEELYKSLDDSADNSNDNAQVCLITNEPLTENYVELECKHTFNYIPLFKDLVNHKTKFSSLESQRLKMNEIRCPYCRYKQDSLLPYIESIGLPKEHGVNWINTEAFNFKSIFDLKVGTCCWGNGEECYYINVITHSEINKDYCYYHYKQICKKILLEKKQAKKADEIKKKHEAKLLIKQQKADEQNKIKEAKLLAKENMKVMKQLEKTKKKTTNMVQVSCIDENVVLSVGTCPTILKSGPRKGEHCNKAIKLNGCCMIHGKTSDVDNISHT